MSESGRIAGVGRAVAVALAVAGVSAAVAEGAWGPTSLVSAPTGVSDPNSDDAAFAAMSNDGAGVFFSTRQRLTTDDEDSGRLDVYERSAGVTRLVSGPSGVADPNSADAAFAGISSDGGRVFFESSERLTADDSDGDRRDVYERSGGLTRLVSQPSGVADPDSDEAVFRELAGGRVFFTTSQKLTADDGDSGRQDVYERAGGVTTLVSTPTGVADPADTSAFFGRASADGSRVFFEANGRLTSDDGDSGQRDVYERAGGVTTLISQPTAVVDPDNAPVFFSALSVDGGRVFFITDQRLSSDDGDTNRRDIYERAGGITTLISKPTGVADPDFDTPFPPETRYVSPDGERVILETTLRLTADDADGLRQDLYQRLNGVTTLLSGPTGVPDLATGDAVFRGASGDATQVFFESGERLSATDDDGTRQDVYQHAGQTTTLVSAPTGVANPNSAPAFFGGASFDGTRVFFTTAERLTAADRDGARGDVYERAGGTTTLLSTPTGVADPASADAVFSGASPLGSIVTFQTPQRMAAADGDSNRVDVYSTERMPTTTTRTPPGAADDTDAAALRAEAARRRDLRSCLGRADRHARRELRRARRLPAPRRTRARRHAKRHKSRLRWRCLRRFGRTPGRVSALKARAASRTSIVLTFGAAGTDGSRAPAARDYLVKQSRRPIRSARAFRRAQTLCQGRCRFPTIARVGGSLELTISDLRPRATYYYAVAARDNVSGRLGPRSRTVNARTR